jgi:DNA repair exonuclease SbcCD ATPase subunit
MTKKDKDSNGTAEETKDLFILQLKIVALNNRVEAMTQRKNALAQELNMLAVKAPEAEQERDKLLATYRPRYEELKSKLEVPEGSELNLETGEVVASQQQ